MTEYDHLEAEELLLRKYAIHGLEKAREDILDRLAGSRHPAARLRAIMKLDLATIARITEFEDHPHLAFGIWQKDYGAFATGDLEDVRDAFLRHLEELGPRPEPQPEPDASESWLYWFVNGWRKAS